MGTEVDPEPREPSLIPSAPPQGSPYAVANLGLPVGIALLWVLSALCYFFHEQPGGGKSAGFDLDWLLPMILLGLGSGLASCLGLALALARTAKGLPCGRLLAASLGGPLLLWGAGSSASAIDKARFRAEARRSAPRRAAAEADLESLMGKLHPRLFDHGQAAPGPTETVALGQGVTLDLVLIPGTRNKRPREPAR